MTATPANIYPVKVNGDEMQMSYRVVVAHDILELAEKQGIINGPPEDYILKSLVVDDREYQWNEEIDLEKNNIFITIVNRPTQVA